MNTSDAFRLLKHPRCSYLYLCVFILLFATIKYKTLGISTGDEGVYYAFSSLWLNGFVPYRDFFVSHPPLHILLSTAVMAVVGIKIMVLNAVPVLITMVSAILIFMIAKRALGEWGALIASILFLFSSVTLYESSHFTGMNLSVLFLLCGIMLFLQKRYFLSGIVLGCGAQAGVYIGVGFIILLCIELWRKSIPLKLCTGFCTSFGGITLMFVLYTGPSFINQVFLYHFRKTAMNDFFANKVAVLTDNIVWHLVLIILSILGILFLRYFYLEWRKGHSDEPFSKLWILLVSAALLCGYGIFLLFFQRVFYHYILLLIPFASILSAYALSTFYALCTSSLTHNDKITKPPLRSTYSIAAIILLLGIHGGISLKTSQHRTQQTAFISAKTIAKELQKEINESQTIFGNFAITPTLSLLSGRRIAAREVDSSAMRFASGMSNIDDVIRNIESDNVGIILSQEVGGIGNYPPFREYLVKNFILKRTFQQNLIEGTPLIEFWKRK